MKPFKCLHICSWWLNACLIGLFGLQSIIVIAFIANGTVTLPDILSQRILKQLRSDQLNFETASIEITPRGRIYLNDLKVFSQNIGDPLIEAESAAIKLNWFENFTPKVSLEKVVVSEGTLYLPASIAANGVHSKILERIAFSIEIGQEKIHVRSFAAKHNNFKLRGEIILPYTVAEADRSEVKEDGFSTEELLKLLKTAVSEINRYDIFDDPTIAFNLLVAPDWSLSLDTELSSPKLVHPKFSGYGFSLKTAFSYEKNILIAQAPALLKLQDLSLPKQDFSAQQIVAYISQENWKDLIQKKWPLFEFSASNLNWQGRNLDHPYIAITSTNFPEFNLRGYAKIARDVLSFDGVINVKDHSGSISAQGATDWLPSLPIAIKEKLPEIHYTQAPYIHALVDLGANFSIHSIQAHIQSQAITLNDITFDSIRSDARYENEQFSLSNTLVQRGQQWVRVGFDFNSNSNQYAVSLVGTAVPYEYNALLPNWWESIFKDFTFEAKAESLGDFIIQGSTQKPVADLFFGHVWATHVNYKGVDINEGTLFVRGRENYVEIDRMDMSNTSGKVKGKIAFTSFQDEVNAPASIRYNIIGNITVKDAQAIFKGPIAEILSDLEMNDAPYVQLEGVQFNDSYPQFSDKSYFNISAKTEEPFLYKKTQLDAVSLDLTRAGDRAALRNIVFKFADGDGQCRADIITTTPDNPSLRFSLSLNNADKDQTLTSIPYIQANAPNAEESKPTRIDLTLDAVGPLNAIDSFSGYGVFRMRSNELGSIQLFGPLSKILQNNRMSFTSFNLQTMDASYQLNGNRIHFDKLSINGPQTRIQATGHLTFPKQDLDMDVSINLLANIGDPDSGLRIVGNILNPILKPLPNLLRFKLNGTLEDQTWRSQYDPRNLFPIFN